MAAPYRCGVPPAAHGSSPADRPAPDGAAPAVSVVVPVRDADADLRRLLTALAAQRGALAFEVVLADDGSRIDPIAALAVAPRLRATVVRVAAPGGPPAGPGAARDAAVARATAPRLAFVDADCRPAPGWLAALMAPLRAPGDVVQGPIRIPQGSTPTPFDRVLARDSASPLFETANLAAWREDVVAAGGFAGGLRPLGGKEMGEDLALGRRLLRAGARVHWAPEAVVEHPVGRRGWRGAAAERARVGAFCTLVARWPELRDDALHRRWFLTPDRPAVLAATAALPLAGALAARRRPIGAALAVLGALPYALQLERRTRPVARGRRPATAVGLAAGDLVTTVALAVGSARSGAPIL